MAKALAAVLGLTRTTIPASRDNPRAKAVNSIRKTIPGKAEARGDGTRREMVLPTEVRIRIQTRLIVGKRRSIPAIAASVQASPPKRVNRTIPIRHLRRARSEEHTSELQSLTNLVCRLL